MALVSSKRAGGPGRRVPHDVPPRYWAFLSYSHKDSETADWLHGALEKYRVPRSLVGRESPHGTIPAGFSPIFRDRHELAASGDLGHTIREALAGSRCLIVLCSPEAASSRWTNEEILAFKKAHPGGCVLAAIVDGEPFASEMKGRAAEECFPPALRQKFDSRGRPTGKRAEPIAADLRANGDGRQLGLLKIVAGMLGVGLDDLVQREQTRRNKRLTFIAAASLAGMAVTSGLAVFAFDKRNEASDQRREAEGLVGFMLGDLRQKLEPIGRLDALDAVGSRALGYFEKQDKSELSDEALAQRSKALTLMGEIAQIRGDLQGALRRYREAMAGTAEMVRREPQNGERIFDHAQNMFWVGAVAYQRGLNGEAEGAWREYKALASRLTALDPSRKDWLPEPIYADTNLGIVLLEQRRFREASPVLRNAMTASEALVASDPKNPAYRDLLVEALAWLSQSRESEGQLDDALALREQQLRLLGREAERRSGDTELKLKLLATHRAIGRLFAQHGDVGQGLSHLRRSAALGETLLQTEPDNTEWAQRAAEVQLELGELELAAGSIVQAGAPIRAGCSIAQRLAAKNQTVTDWRLGLQSLCLERKTRLALLQSSFEEAEGLADQSLALSGREYSRTRTLDSRFALAEARLLRGQVAQAMGDRSTARVFFESSLSAWPEQAEMIPRQLARQQLLFEALGKRVESNAASARLRAMGYRHPVFTLERRLMRG